MWRSTDRARLRPPPARNACVESHAPRPASSRAAFPPHRVPRWATPPPAAAKSEPMRIYCGSSTLFMLSLADADPLPPPHPSAPTADHDGHAPHQPHHGHLRRPRPCAPRPSAPPSPISRGRDTLITLSLSLYCVAFRFACVCAGLPPSAAAVGVAAVFPSDIDVRSPSSWARPCVPPSSLCAR